MDRLGILIVLAVTASGLVGCAMCASPFDYDYPGYGGRIERIDRQRGRVGSAFTRSAAHPVTGAGAGPEVEWLPGPGEEREPAGTAPPPADSMGPSEDAWDWDLETPPSEPTPMERPGRMVEPGMGVPPLLEDLPPEEDDGTPAMDSVDARGTPDRMQRADGLGWPEGSHAASAGERAAALQSSLSWDFPAHEPADGEVALVGVLSGEDDDQRSQ